MKARRVFVAVLVVSLYLEMGVRAQDVSKPTVMAKDADPDWEVATVKLNESGISNDRIHIRGRHVTIENETVARMMLIGYGVQKDQIAGLPDWAKTVGWDIDGVTDVAGVPNLRQFQTMVRKIIEERFGLVLHHEQRVMEVFALRVTKGGPKLNAATGGADAFPDRVDRRSAGQLASTFKNTSMHDFVLMALGDRDRPVVDETGLTGKYDFQLTWNDAESATLTEDSAAPGLFTALQEQLGLKLEPVKAPADVLVVDKVERPNAN
ncbi:MAG TPA: TIGR03435 family protein [Acidobacteriaceae bacterium]|nr:TIGR03435 family protein [Acidobacteriaceae bacterium]